MAGEGDLTFATGTAYLARVIDSAATAIIVASDDIDLLPAILQAAVLHSTVRLVRLHSSRSGTYQDIYLSEMGVIDLALSEVLSL